MQVGYTDENGDPQCCVPEAYQERVPQSPTTLSASATLLLLPTGLSVHSQPAASYTAASTTNVAVTLQLLPALAVTSGHPFAIAMASVSESGVPPRQAYRFSCMPVQNKFSVQEFLSTTSKPPQVRTLSSPHISTDFAYSFCLL